MRPRTGSVRWTYEDYKLFPDDGKRYQIIRGERIVTPAPRPRHQLVCGRIEHALRSLLDQEDLGECYGSPIDVVLAEDSVVQPDIAFISKERLRIVEEEAITEAPDLVIEVLSPSTRRMDFGTKRKLYADFGVREYWLVDPEVDRIELFVLEGGELVKKAEVSEGQARSLVVLPDFTVELSRIFE